MATPKKSMNVSLTSKLEGMVRKLVKSGRYNSASEVVRDGLRLVQDRERLREIKLQELRKAIQEGRESGSGTPWDLDDFKNSAKKRYSERTSK
jgi:antitoxin ParD1/3/4